MNVPDVPERGWATRHTRGDLTGKPALFLDRDGTVIQNVPYLNDPAGISLIPGVKESISAFRSVGYAVIMVTNQSGIARGLVSPEAYRAVEAAVIEALGPGLLDATYACPFHQEHPWRKPAAGMLLAAAQDHGLTLEQSAMVGDSLSDMQAGAYAGVTTLVHVRTGHGESERTLVEGWANDHEPVLFIDSLSDLTLPARSRQPVAIHRDGVGQAS